MTCQTIAVLSPGNMGGAAGGQLAKSGYRVISCLGDRSQFTRDKAAAAGIEGVADLEVLVREADLLLSILDPGKAERVAGEVADALRTTGAALVYADCNATSPATAEWLNAIITGVGGKFIDVGIIGGAPLPGKEPPSFASSGPDARLLDAIDGKGVRQLYIGPDIGQGSAIKICNGAFNKGAFALYTSVMLAAEHYGCTEFLRERLPASQAGTVAKLDGAILRLPTLSGRYIGEMEQVAETFEAIGLPGDIHRGAAELFRLLNDSPLAAERRDEIDAERTVPDTLRALAQTLAARDGAG